MIPSSLAGIVIWNGGLPIPPLETAMVQLARRELDPLVRSHLTESGVEADLDAVQDAFLPTLFTNLPPGWTLVGAYRGVPQIHLRYSGEGLDGTPFAGMTADVFLCIATSSKDEPPKLRALYVRDLPLPGENRPGRFAELPYSAQAAWLTLFVWGRSELRTSWKRSSDVPGHFTFEGEVLASDLV